MTRETHFLWLLLFAIMVASFAIGQDEANTASDSSGAIDLDPDLTVTNSTSLRNKELLKGESAIVDGLPRANVQEGDSPDDKIAKLFGRAQFQSSIGNDEGALEICDKMLEIDPANRAALFKKSNVLIQLQRHKEALEILRQLSEDYPDDFSLKNNIAWILATASNLDMRDGKKALSLARDALLLAPNNHQVWNTLSEAYFISAEYDKALDAAKISFKIARANGEPNKRLQDLAEQVRKCKQAAITMSIMD